jgi:DNA modification methylase
VTFWRVTVGDCRTSIGGLSERSVQTCITSPPYFGLRDYGVSGQLGRESTPDEYVAKLVDVFREVRRVLRDDGTCWLNLGDSFGPGKQLLGVPWRVAFALQADGWILRSDIIWGKTNPMPESVRDRPTRAHEYIFLLVKGPRYFYDAGSIREDGAMRLDFGEMTSPARVTQGAPWSGGHKAEANGRNKWDVWTVSTKPYAGAHFAVFPPDLIEPCVLAGSRPGDVVLDPFAGTGTTGMVALRHGRSFIGLELNPAYVELARDRIVGDAPLLNSVSELTDQRAA